MSVNKTTTTAYDKNGVSLGTVSSSETHSNKLGSVTVSYDYRKRLETRSESTSSLAPFILLRVVLVCLLGLSVFSILFGRKTIFGLGSFLESLSNVPSFDLSPITTFVNSWAISSDWGVFNFLRDFFNTITSSLGTAISFVAFVGTGFYQLINFVAYFLRLI